MGGRLRAVRAAEIVDTLHKAFVKASQAPDMQDKFHKGGMVAPQQASLDDAKAWLRTRWPPGGETSRKQTSSSTSELGLSEWLLGGIG